MAEFEKFQYAQTAAILAGDRKDSKYTSGALEMLAGEEGLNLGEDAMGFVKGAGASRDGIKTAIAVYGKKLGEALTNTTVDEYLNWYQDTMEGIPEEDKSKLEAVLKNHGNEKVGEIGQRLSKAKQISEDKNDLFTEDQKKEAKQTLQIYEDYLNVSVVLEQYKHESLRNKAVNVSRKNDLTTAASEL